jgi:hypothetical protein
MRPAWKKAAAVGFLVFVGLWVVGAVRGLTLPFPPPSPAYYLSGIEDLASSARSRTAQNMKQINTANVALPLMLDQPAADKIEVHEKSAHLALGTTAFDEDVGAVRATLAAYQGTVFEERDSGIAPDRRLVLQVGVAPAQFDALVAQLRQVGHLETVTVQQRDRTGEFRKLNAQRQALQKYREAVLKLRGTKAPTVDEALKLEQRLQEIEKELQGLNVQLGDLVGGESYYVVYLSLSEYQPGSRLDRTYTVPQRVLHAGLWALVWWLAAAAGATVVAGTVLSVRTLWPGRAQVSQ